MLKTTQEFLTTEEVAVLREWLKNKGARLFRKCVQSKVQENQIEATRKFSDERERMDEDGRLLMKKSHDYRAVLKVLDEFSEIKHKPYTVRIEEESNAN